ncbi:Ff.00g085530.m01.CDS01 [Fusarium sp. VM40]|nr:Ff.00g085530.m01.CDS01 [Fusarium sp. VM40]
MSSSSPYLDIHHTTDAVIQWESDGKTRSLSKGDPKATPVTLTTRFDKTCAFFELSVPLKLKGIDHTTITLRTCASSIISLDLVKNPTVPDALQQELGSISLCLGLALSRPLDVFLPTAALEPVAPARAPSGLVLDAVRDLCQATAFSIYIEARENPGFQAISDSANQGLLKSFRSSRFQLASMYGGQGAKLVNLAGDTSLPPPSYNEVEPPPPPPPIDLKNDRKRPRQDSQNEHNNNIALIWKELQDMKDIMARDAKRIEALETENEKLRQENKDVTQGMDKLRERCTVMETSQQDLKHSLEVLDTDSERFMKMATEELLDTYDNDLVELREDMRAMEQAVKYIEEGHVSDESVKRIKDAVVQDITTRLSAD